MLMYIANTFSIIFQAFVHYRGMIQMLSNSGFGVVFEANIKTGDMKINSIDKTRNYLGKMISVPDFYISIDLL
jgi:hypothetical protein